MERRGEREKTGGKRPAMELLAPAGSPAAFEAALAAGADAVYVGAPALSARAMAREFTFAEIGAMIRQAHGAGKKLYIAMNSLAMEVEVRRVVEALSIFSRLAPDALILQDPGILYLAQRYFPELVLHASTLMSVHNSSVAHHLAELGFSRVVLARELTLAEIGEIGRQAGVELEIFVHGAMCFSYSGLCLFSSLHGGRSSLRGQCVQPCRRRYTWQSGRGQGNKAGSGYLFSMNDLSGISLLPELERVGVKSLKIEGRLRSVEYVRQTVRAYRLALDSLALPPRERQPVLAEAEQILDQAMGRRRSTGYFLDARPEGAVTPAISGNTGILLGKVERLEKQGKKGTLLRVRLRAEVATGDRLRLHDEATGERQAFTVRTLLVRGRIVARAAAGQMAGIVLPGELAVRSRKTFRGLVFRVDVREKGGQHSARLRVGGKKRIGPDRVLVERVLEDLPWRPLTSHTLKARKGQGRGRRKQRHHARNITWWVRVDSLRFAGRRLPVRPARLLVPLDRENVTMAVEKPGRWRSGANRLVWCLPPVIHEQDITWFREQIARLLRSGFSGFQLGHLTQMALFPADRQATSDPALHLYGDYTFNMLNSTALAACHRLGLAGVQFSLETDRQNLAAALAGFSGMMRREDGNGTGMKIGLLAYGRPPLFTSRLEAAHLRYRQTLVSPRGERFILDHDHGLTHARAERPFSLLQYRAELLRSGVDYLVLDLSGGPLQREAELLSILLRGSGRQPVVMAGNYDGTLL